MFYVFLLMTLFGARAELIRDAILAGAAMAISFFLGHQCGETGRC